jgi:hypothetical protein
MVCLHLDNGITFFAAFKKLKGTTPAIFLQNAAK